MNTNRNLITTHHQQLIRRDNQKTNQLTLTSLLQTPIKSRSLSTDLSQQKIKRFKTSHKKNTSVS
jgi:hypothetical protein